ncbi:hypothetical protein EDI_093180 [Entamoeba dispar SAW760]|uniref:C2 domain-containing protein n=1 Tax=Entamoeba dispar (strain ATCC PRA-260 / SAW760) TaxID=370354 RepID=B0EDB0_ENTDS|nr:uncharacterized protein EDI_093180 [Entamoeba dispar SAW760]EDR27527.1 hypothetical protein EDI_093180 [Entamoeba dispar SAW760]|eukprot:EDR27527.1 hypothetical protein EDI_093180 [Entamoeba dispar SAW760]
MVIYSVLLNIVSATDLYADITGILEAYVSFKTNRTEKQTTRQYEKSLNPFWCEEFPAVIEDGEEIIFHIKNGKSLKKSVGIASYVFSPMKIGDIRREKIPIKDVGTLTIKITCQNIEQPPYN